MSQYNNTAGVIDDVALGKPLGEATAESHSGLATSGQGIGHTGQFGLQDKSIGSTGSGLTEQATHHHGHSGAHQGHHHQADSANVGHVGMFGLEDKSIGSSGSGLTEAVTHHHGHSATAGTHQSHHQGHHVQHEPLDPAIAAGLGAGHHDKDPLPAIHGSSGSAHPIADQYTSGSSHVGRDAAIGAGAIGAGGAGVAAADSHIGTPHSGTAGTTQAQAPIAGDVYGKSHGQNEYSNRGISIPEETKGANSHNTSDSTRGVGIGLGGAGAAAGAGAGAAALSGSSSSNDPIAALKQELKDNQSSGTGSGHEVDAKGPHGLVWSDADGGKYVHQRELDGKGSTGVDLSGSNARQ